MTTDAPVGGTCDPTYDAVRLAFVENFTDRGEHGAAVCLVVDGRVVCDLWGGWRDADRTVPWAADTLVNVFSVGKGVSATCLSRLVGHGALDPGAPVSSYWPEFAAAGKSAVTVRHVLAHQAGLPAVRARLPPGAMLDHDAMAEALASEHPWWEPGTAHGYHVNTWGFLVGEIVRRAAGRSLGGVLRDDVAGPLGADVHLGVGDADLGRVAEFLWPARSPGDLPADDVPAGLTSEQLMEYNAYSNPAGLSGAGVVNTAAWRRAEIPSTNMHVSARGVARLYEMLAAGGELDGERIVSSDALADATRPVADGDDLILHRPSRFGLGFQLTQPERPLGPNPGAYGHFGAGGSLGFCDPEAGVAFGYVMNRLGPRWQNPLNRALIDAVYASTVNSR